MIMTRRCLVISVKTLVNFVPLQKSYLETLNQYRNNILNGDGMQFLKLLVQNIEGNVTSGATTFRLQETRVQINLQPDVTSLCVG